MPRTPSLFAALAMGIALGGTAWAQETPPAPGASQAPEARPEAPAPDAAPTGQAAPSAEATEGAEEATPSGEAATEAESAAEPAAAEPAGEAATPEDAAAAGEGLGAAAEDAAADAPEAELGAAGEVLEIVRDTFGEWEVRCLPDETECFLYQLADDAEGNPVAEISILKLPEDAEAAAGMTVVTPLGTLLPEGLVLQVDGGEARQYPFTFCSQVGCFARFGLTQEAIDAMKRGNVAAMRLVSVGAPQDPVELEVSLSGFTAAYDSLTAATAPAQ